MTHWLLVGSGTLLVATRLAAAPPPTAGAEAAGLARFGHALGTRYDVVARDLVEAAEAVPEAEYRFRPTRDVRSFGEIIGHVADAQNYLCGVANGTSPEYHDTIEKSRRAKADLVKALKDSVAFCDGVYRNLSADRALELVQMGAGDVLRAMALVDNVSHDNEHYGNLVTYMRLNGRVPPSTARQD